MHHVMYSLVTEESRYSRHHLISRIDSDDLDHGDESYVNKHFGLLTHIELNFKVMTIE